MKKIFLLTFVVSAMSLFAESGTDGTIIWSVANDTLTLSGSGNMNNYTSANPNKAPWNESTFSTVVVGKDITGIGKYAFYKKELTGVLFEPGSQLTSIGDCAFILNNFTELSFPSSLQTIGSSTFKYCSQLVSVTFGTNSQLNTISSGAFVWCGLTEIDIPISVQTMGSEVFLSCLALSKVYVHWTENLIENYHIFDFIAEDPILYVPKNTKTMYENDASWSDVFQIIEQDETSSTFFTFKNDDDLKIYTEQNKIIIENAPNTLEIYTVSGNCVAKISTKENHSTVSIPVSHSGVYILKTDKKSYKVLVGATQ